MNISKIVVTHHRTPVVPPFPAAWDSRPRDRFEATVVRVYGEDGSCGVGSGDAMHGFGDYAGLFLGQPVDQMERHNQVLENVAFHASRCWPLDVALWDLKGKREGKPVFRLLGGVDPDLKLYASTGSHRDAQATSQQVRGFAAQGFEAAKLRLSRGDLAQNLKALDGALSADTGLKFMVDCNQGWRMAWDTQAPWPFEQVRELAQELQRRGVLWMEEPLHRGDYLGMSRLSEEMEMWIAGGEMTRDSHEFDELIRRRCLDVLQPDVVVSLGITGLYRVGTRAKEQGIRFTPHTWGNGFGLVANAHVAAAVGTCPYLEYPLDPPEWTESIRDFFLAEPLSVQRGILTLSERPGLGVALDEDTLARTEVSRVEYR